MSDSLLTKCPHCRTLFRLKLDHLAAAEGEVRCGVCFKVFNAQQQGVSYSTGEGSDADTTFGRKTDNTASSKNNKKSNKKTKGNDSLNKEAQASVDEGATNHLIDGTQAITDQVNEDGKGDGNADGEQPAAAAKSQRVKAETTAPPPSQEDLNKLEIASESMEALLFDRKAGGQHSRTLYWSTLSIAALLVLTLQWAWFNRNDYAHDPNWHRWYNLACNTFGCELPSYTDLVKIRTERLEVRSHPEFENVLIIDMIVNNQGNLPQKPPSLNVEFFDIDGQTLTQRVFQPSDYLGETDRQLNQLPVNVPVRFSFAVLDPGERAINYAVSLL